MDALQQYHQEFVLAQQKMAAAAKSLFESVSCLPHDRFNREHTLAMQNRTLPILWERARELIINTKNTSGEVLQKGFVRAKTGLNNGLAYAESAYNDGSAYAKTALNNGWEYAGQKANTAYTKALELSEVAQNSRAAQMLVNNQGDIAAGVATGVAYESGLFGTLKKGVSAVGLFIKNNKATVAFATTLGLFIGLDQFITNKEAVLSAAVVAKDSVVPTALAISSYVTANYPNLLKKAGIFTASALSVVGINRTLVQ